MTQHVPKWISKAARLVLAAGLAAGVAGGALAQETDIFKRPGDAPPPKPRTATSSLEATQPSRAEVKESRALASAVFARPAAAARAADKAAAAAPPEVPPVQAKPEWTNSDGLSVGGKGIQFKSPF